MAGRRVFVSYSQSDGPTAMELVSHAEREGIECWVAPRDVAPGADWAAEIVEAIAEARIMVLVFSGSANHSPQVRREVERAVHREVNVLPFRIEDVAPSHSLEYFLSSQHWLDAFPPPMAPHYDRLCRYLKTLLVHYQNPTGSALAPEAGPLPAAVVPPAPVAAVESRHDSATLQSLEAQLAGYIGPVARLLVKNAAQRQATVEALIRELASEIESEAEQREFMEACRRALRGHP